MEITEYTDRIKAYLSRGVALPVHFPAQRSCLSIAATTAAAAEADNRLATCHSNSLRQKEAESVSLGSHLLSGRAVWSVVSNRAGQSLDKNRERDEGC